MVELVTVTEENCETQPYVCFINAKHPSYSRKPAWLAKRFAEGLTITLLYDDNQKKPIGFIEYVPGEYAWRAVDAQDYLFIHCLWITPNKYKNQGNASLLIDACRNEARRAGMRGVATLASGDSFMAGSAIFLKNGFKSIATAPPLFDLMAYQFKKGPLPSFRDWEAQLENYAEGLHIVYADQCPWVARSIDELTAIAAERTIDVVVTELKTPHDAQHAPTPYGVFALIKDGVILADHYISGSRFRNILSKAYGPLR